MHADNYGGNDIAIYFYTLDDNRGPVHARIHNRGEHLDGPEYDAAIDQLLDHIDVERLHASIKRRGLDVYLGDGVHDPVYDGPATRLPDDQPAVHDPRDYSLELLDCLLDTCCARAASSGHPTAWLIDILWLARDRWVAAHP